MRGHTHTHSINMGCEEPNFGPLVCEANVLTSEPSPQPLSLFSKVLHKLRVLRCFQGRLVYNRCQLSRDVSRGLEGREHTVTQNVL